MVKINEIKGSVCELYGPDGLIGTVPTITSLLDVCVQVKELKSTEYYIIYEDQKVMIKTDGRLENIPKGFYLETATLLDKLFA